MNTLGTRLLLPALIAATTLLPQQGTAQIVGTPSVAVTPIPGTTVLAPVQQTPFFQGVPANATIPHIVPDQCVPRPLQADANPNLREIRITFDQAMDVALFYWPLPTNDPYFPTVTNNPFWTNGNRTLVLPVILAPGRSYAIPINSPTLVFRAATGLYANPGLFRFQTRTSSQGGSVSIGRGVTVPNLTPTVVPVVPPLTGRSAQYGGTSAAAPAVIGATPAPAAGNSVNTGGARSSGQALRQNAVNPALRHGMATPTPTPTPRRR